MQQTIQHDLTINPHKHYLQRAKDEEWMVVTCNNCNFTMYTRRQDVKMKLLGVPPHCPGSVWAATDRAERG